MSLSKMRLPSHDASFLYSETASGYMHNTAISLVEGDLTYERYVDFIAGRIHLMPRLRQRLAFVPGNLAHPKWVDDPEFDLRNHLLHHPTDGNLSEEEAIEVALSLSETLLDRSMPLWLIYVIENVDGNTMLAQLTHHAMIDGASYVQMGELLSEPSPEGGPVPPPAEQWSPKPLQTPEQLWLEALAESAQENTSAFFNPSVSSSEQQELTARGNAIMQRLALQPAITAPWNAAPVGPKRTLSYCRYRVDHFSAIRKALGGTFNDVALSVLSEAASRYLAHHKEPTENQYLRLMCPVNVRVPGDVEIGNKVSAFYPRLPAWPMPVTERLAAVHEEMQSLKEANEAHALHSVTETAPEIPPMMMAPSQLVGTAFDPSRLGARYPAPVPPQGTPRPPLLGFNFTCSNVPGMPTQQYVAGHKVLTYTGTLQLSGTLGFGVTVGSANGDVFINLTADPRLLPDLAVMREFVEEVFAELQAASA